MTSLEPSQWTSNVMYSVLSRLSSIYRLIVHTYIVFAPDWAPMVATFSKHCNYL